MNNLSKTKFWGCDPCEYCTLDYDGYMLCSLHSRFIDDYSVPKWCNRDNELKYLDSMFYQIELSK